MLDCYSSDNGMLASNVFSSSMVTNSSMLDVAPPLAALRDMAERRGQVTGGAEGDLLRNSDEESDSAGEGVKCAHHLVQFTGSPPASASPYGDLRCPGYGGGGGGTAAAAAAAAAAATPHGITDILGRKLAAAEAARQANLPSTAAHANISNLQQHQQHQQQHQQQQQALLFPQSVNHLATQRHMYPSNDCTIGWNQC